MYGQISRQEPLRNRTKKFALRIIRRFRASTTLYGGAGSRQTVVAVRHFRRRELPGCSRSNAEFVSKVGLVVAAADETVFWLDCLVESGIVKEEWLKDLLGEANDLGAIFKTSRRTARPW